MYAPYFSNSFQVITTMDRKQLIHGEKICYKIHKLINYDKIFNSNHSKTDREKAEDIFRHFNFMCTGLNSSPYLPNVTNSRQNYTFEIEKARRAVDKIRNSPQLSPAFNLLNWFGSPDVYLAGGCFLSVVFDMPINDFDFFFRNEKTRLQFQEFLIAEGYRIACITDNAITLTKEGHTPIQLITAHYYSYPECTLASFDLSPAMCAVVKESDELFFICETFWIFTLNNLMYYNEYSIGDIYKTIPRILKYRDKYKLQLVTDKTITFDLSRLIESFGNKTNPYEIGENAIWAKSWANPGDQYCRYDLLGDLPSPQMQEFDKLSLFQLELQNLLNNHTKIWSNASVRRIILSFNKLYKHQPKAKDSTYLYMQTAISEIKKAEKEKIFPFALSPALSEVSEMYVKFQNNQCSNSEMYVALSKFLAYLSESCATYKESILTGEE